MKRYITYTVAGICTLFLVGCGGGGSPLQPPTNISVAAGDTSVTVSWDMLPGVDYWIFYAPGTYVSPQNCDTTPGCATAGYLGTATSPAVISGLANGTTYAFSINARRDPAAGGPGSTPLTATPRLAGSAPTWSTGSSFSSSTIRGIAYGSVLVAAGDSGALFSSEDGVTWTPLTNPVPGASLYAVTYYGGQYLAVGTGGVILRSTDAITWTQQASPTTNDLYAISNYGVDGFVATGASGTILNSTNGVNWYVVSPTITTNALNGVTWGYNRYVAVGAAGTILTCTATCSAGGNWTVVTPSPTTTSNLNGISYGLPLALYGYVTQNATIGIFTAVGANGTLVTSTDGGTSWSTTTPTVFSSNTLNAVTFGHQFIALDNSGNIYSSTDGFTWTNDLSTGSALYAITPALMLSGQYINQYVYSVVGVGGTNLLAR